MEKPYVVGYEDLTGEDISNYCIVTSHVNFDEADEKRHREELEECMRYFGNLKDGETLGEK